MPASYYWIASWYEMRISNDQSSLRHDFMSADLLNVSSAGMTPNVSGKVERLQIVVSSVDAFTTTTYLAIVAIDEVGNRGEVSNIIPITIGLASQFLGNIILCFLFFFRCLMIWPTLNDFVSQVTKTTFADMHKFAALTFEELVISVFLNVLRAFLCPRHEMAEGHIEFNLSMCVCVYVYVCVFVYSRIVSGP